MQAFQLGNDALKEDVCSCKVTVKLFEGLQGVKLIVHCLATNPRHILYPRELNRIARQVHEYTLRNAIHC